MAPDLQCQVVFQVSYEFTFSLLMFENSTPTDTSPALRSIHFLSTYFVILWVKLQFLLLLVNIRIKYLYHFYLFLFFFFFSTGVWTQNLQTWATSPALFLWRVFQDRVLQTICLGWLQTMILLIAAFWVARITGVSHWYLTCFFF
jgi:hypothetical protein